MEVEEVAMKPLSAEKSQKIIAVEQKLKYHTFPSLKTKGGITNQIICIISLNLCQLSIGFGLGFSAISIPQIKVAKSQRIVSFLSHNKKTIFPIYSILIIGYNNQFRNYKSLFLLFFLAN